MVDRDAEAVIAMTLAAWYGSGLGEQRLLAERIAEALRAEGFVLPSSGSGRGTGK